MRPNRLSILLLLGFLFLFVNLVRMQILKGPYYRSLSERNRIRVIYLEGGRGKILDRNGQVLAKNHLSFNCSAVAREAKSRIKRSCEILSPILAEDALTLEERFRKKKPGAFHTVLMAEDIDASQAIAIEERLDQLPGFMIETRPQREYPYGESAAHLTGYIGPLTEDEKEAMELYNYNYADWAGREGVERSYESYLRGYSGGLQIEVDSRGRIIRALGVREPREGKDIQLTVDARLQSKAQALLKGQKGSVIIIEMENGGLLAMNSSPSFDPNLFASKKGRKDVGKYLTNDEEAPMVNRGIRSNYPPGSIFKIVTAIAGLSSGKITPATSFNCRGYLMIGGIRFGCWKDGGHGPQSMSEAFAHSCNVYFYSIGLLTGIDVLHEKSVEFGFYLRTGVDLPGEKQGFVPSKEWKKKKRHLPWYEGETANLAIGQGDLQVTPLQALMMAVVAAAEGQVLRPHVIDKIDGIKVAEKNAGSMRVPAAHWKSVKEGLDQVVNSDTGTGRLARRADTRVAGKTGTAQSGQDKTHAWFVGFAPKDKPKIALVVFLEHGGRGGVAAASIANQLLQGLKETGYL